MKAMRMMRLSILSLSGLDVGRSVSEIAESDILEPMIYASYLTLLSMLRKKSRMLSMRALKESFMSYST
jgi:hypothetical protein